MCFSIDHLLINMLYQRFSILQQASVDGLESKCLCSFSVDFKPLRSLTNWSLKAKTCLSPETLLALHCLAPVLGTSIQTGLSCEESTYLISPGKTCTAAWYALGSPLHKQVKRKTEAFNCRNFQNSKTVCSAQMAFTPFNKVTIALFIIGEYCMFFTMVQGSINGVFEISIPITSLTFFIGKKLMIKWCL